jgi:hypothetical protein
MISDLLQNKVDMSQLVITKALSKESWYIVALSPLLIRRIKCTQLMKESKPTTNWRSECVNAMPDLPQLLVIVCPMLSSRG